MKDLFINFLKERNAYDSFVSMFSINNKIEDYLDELESEPIFFITDAFRWDRTEEGGVYWSELSGDWLDLINKKKQENEKNN